MFHSLHVFMEVIYQLNRGGMADFVQLLRLYKYDIRKEVLSILEIPDGGLEQFLCASSMRKDLKMLYLMIPYCRDVIRGKGERDLAYQLIYAFYQVFPVLAIKAIHLLFQVREGLPMVGSWCDIKYFSMFVERNSPWGADDPLIAIMASIANKNIDNNQVAKWIPREKHHPGLFSVFAGDFSKIIPGRIVSSVKKGLYRKRVSRCPLDTKGASACGFPTRFMGKYVREAVHLIQDEILTGERIEALERRWQRLLKTFPHFTYYGLPIVDLDIHISDDMLFHSIGFACLIAEKMGLKRILLAGVVPILVDVSLCHGFIMGMVRVLWAHCHGRGVSRLGDAIDLVKKGFKFVDESELLIFILSERFDFDWRSFILSGKCIPVFWNLGTSFVFPVDFYVESDINNSPLDFIYMSGYSSGLLMPFFSNDIRVHGFYENVLESYHEWSAYFDLFISNVYMPFTMPFGTTGTTGTILEAEDQ